MKFTAHPHPMPGLRLSGAVPLLSMRKSTSVKEKSDEKNISN